MKKGKNGTSSADTLFGTSKADSINGRDGDDWIDGGNGNDKINGGKGNDTINGGAGDDRIKGQSGNDLITGGAGADKLTGNNGNDHFIYQGSSDSPAASGWDRITDFTQGNDKIDLAALLGSADLAWGNTTATTNGAWYQSSGCSTFVYADTDGNGTADLKIELKNTTGLVLTVNDFIGVSEAQGNNAPVAVADNVITNVSPGDPIFIPEWALLANDTDAEGDPIDVESVGNATGEDVALLTPGVGSDGFVTFLDADEFSASSFTYVATDGELSSNDAVVDVSEDLDGIIDGTIAEDILVGAQFEPTVFVGNGGNDIMFGGNFNDVFDYNALSDRGTTGDVISGFQKGSDVLDLRDLLDTFSGYDGGNAVSGGYLSFSNSGSNAVVQVDSDGSANSDGGVDSPAVTLVTVLNVSLDIGDFLA